MDKKEFNDLITKVDKQLAKGKQQSKVLKLLFAGQKSDIISIPKVLATLDRIIGTQTR